LCGTRARRSIDENFPLPRPSREKRVRRKREFNSNDAEFFFFNEVFHQHTKGRDILLTHARAKRERKKQRERRTTIFRWYFLVQIVRVYIQVWVCSPPRARSFLSLSLCLSFFPLSRAALNSLFFLLLLLLRSFFSRREVFEDGLWRREKALQSFRSRAKER